MKSGRPTVASIDLNALAANYAEAKRLADGRDVIAVVKADAYGHGAAPIARRLAAAGCRSFAVATIAEAAELRAAGIQHAILVLGGVHDAAEADEAVALGVTPVVQHAGHLALLRKVAAERSRTIPVQVEVDTGMARMGISPEEAPSLIEGIARDKAFALDGVYSHLACADESDLAPTLRQLALFAEVLAALRSRAVAPRQVHVANSAALVAGGDGALAAATPAEVNAVRPGIMLYGVAPAPHLADAAKLAPVMSVRTRVANVRWVRRGDPVGYGATFRAKQRGRIATLPIGYADGIPWTLGNRGFVLLRGRRVPIAGRVSMDLITLDVGSSPVEIGDAVLVFGAPAGGGAPLRVEEVAEAAGTVPYELLVRVGARVPRVLES
ncbi:MAG TPA: alanine racemase [Myxococcota bacterium]|nr:alanine racemase [Myxococcota bacterium]